MGRPRSNRVVYAYVTEAPVVDLLLVTNQEVLLAINNLRQPYDAVIKKDLPDPPKATRTALAVMPHRSLVVTEGSLPDPASVPAIVVQPGSDFIDFHSMTFGVTNRGELRRLEDFLAPFGLSLAPVSTLCKISNGGVTYAYERVVLMSQRSFMREKGSLM